MNNKNDTETSMVLPKHRAEHNEICAVEPRSFPGDFDDNYVCPNCGTIIGSVPVIHRAYTIPRFCEKCGARFIWVHEDWDKRMR